MLDDDDDDLLVSQLNMNITNQYVVFSVEEEDYGLPILSVQEIISLPDITKIPDVPSYIPGIINLRGTIIPLYLLRSKFHHKKEEVDSNSIVVIVQTNNEKNRIIGLIVDSVSDVVSIEDGDFQKTTEYANSIDCKFIDKIGHIGSRMIVIIDMDNFLGGESVVEDAQEF